MSESEDRQKTAFPGRIVRAAWREAWTPFNVAFWIILAVVLTVAGPFGTYSVLDVGTRLLFWMLVVPISGLIGFQVVFHVRALWPGQHPLSADGVASVGIVALFTPVLYPLTHALVVVPGAEGPSFPLLAMYVFIVSIGILTTRRLIPGIEARNYLPKTHDINRPRLLRRVPQLGEAQVIRITSQGHFVDIVTDRGTERIRMRLSDAVGEMDGVAGHLVHRSHWVAEAAIEGCETAEGRVQLRLSNGDVVPVSRTYKTNLESAGVA